MQLAPDDKPKLNLQGIGLLLLALCTATAVCAGFYLREAGNIEQRLQDRETAKVGLLAELFHSDLQSAVNTLQILADSEGLRTYLASNLQTDLDRVARRAVFVSKQQKSFDQVRYIDEHGQEVVRANHGGILVPADQLQNKFQTDYFQKVSALTAGQIFVSNFELNVERGQIEQPLKPTLRFAAPVFDKKGRRGAYVINYRGSDLLDHLQRSALTLQHRLRLLDADGYWIKADEPAHEWGSTLPGRAGFTLAQTDPNLWSRISREPEGQISRKSGLFTWRRLTPQDIVGGPIESVVANDRFWIIASEVSPADWSGLFVSLRQAFLLIEASLVILICSSASFIRARKGANRALRRSEENLAVTLNSIGDGVIATDVAGKVTRLNRVAEELTGWKIAEAQGLPIDDIYRIVHENTHEAAVIPVKDVLSTGMTHGIAKDILLISKDGTKRSIADNASAIRDREGRIIGVVLAFRDVTEERAAEKKLAAARAELDRFFTLSLDCLCISSIDGYFKRVSPAITDILGWTVDEFLAQPYITLVHPDDSDATLAEVDKQIRQGKKVFQFENRYRHKDGSWRVLSWRSVPQPGGLMYATARDVTDLKASAEQISKLNSDLQHRAVQLEASNKELESFSYSVSHDLRAPLRHVQGYVAMLTREVNGNLSEKALRYLQTISTAGLEMGELIDNLLSFSRMGRAEMRERTVDLNPIIHDCRQTLELSTQGRNIHWEIEALPPVQGDPAMLKQVFANLLNNAVKYSRNRDPATIVVGVAGEEDGRAIFFVRDNGAGFDMKYVDKLFGVFQRLHNGDEFEGTGIGLASVRRIIIRHGGRTWAEGKVDAGATVYFTLTTAASLVANPS